MRDIILNHLAVDKATLYDFFISSVDNNTYPKWTEEHIDELCDNFIVISKEYFDEHVKGD